MLNQILFIKDLLELSYKYKKVLLIIFIMGSFLFLLLLSWGGSIDEEQKMELNQHWKKFAIGDSIYVKENVYQLEFFKKGREKLDEYEQRKIKYEREDTLNFVRKNDVPEKYFYRSNTSFVGICIGKDSSITEAGEYKGHRWLKIKPSYEITHPPPSGKYDYDKRKWKEGKPFL